MARIKEAKAKKGRRENETVVRLVLFRGAKFVEDGVRRKRDADRLAILEAKRGKELGLLLIGYTEAMAYEVRYPVFGMRKFKSVLALDVTARRWLMEYDRLPTEQIVPEAMGL